MIGNGYIVGNGNNFFGIEYEKKLELVYDKINNTNLKFQIVYSKSKKDNELGSVNITEYDTLENQNVKKEKIITENVNLKQIWFQSKEIRNNNKALDNLEKFCYLTIQKFYSDKNFIFGFPQFELSLYTKNCFIANHKDGYDLDEFRLCVVILYLSKNWQKGDGGELIIIDENNKEILIEPKFGNFAILDFIKNNLKHEVKKINSDTHNRKALISFMMKKNKN